jgi:hypothetical protein
MRPGFGLSLRLLWKLIERSPEGSDRDELALNINI